MFSHGDQKKAWLGVATFLASSALKSGRWFFIPTPNITFYGSQNSKMVPTVSAPWCYSVMMFHYVALGIFADENKVIYQFTLK